MQARMRHVYFLAVVAAASVVVFGGTALAQSSNSEVGTWKLNLAKSKYSQGPVPKSTTIKTEAAGAAVKTVVDSVSADGIVIHYELTMSYDGKDTPVVGNSPNGDTISRLRINPTTTTTVNKKGGRITTTAINVVSSDGKTRTITTTGENALGQSVNSVAVYDKQ